MAYLNIREFQKISEKCRPFVRPLLCHYQFPSCDSSSSVPKPRQICYEECEILRTSICAEEYLISKRLTLQQVLFPECSSLPREDTEEGKNCIKLDVTVNKSKAKSPKPPKPEKPALEKGTARREKGKCEHIGEFQRPRAFNSLTCSRKRLVACVIAALRTLAICALYTSFH